MQPDQTTNTAVQMGSLAPAGAIILALIGLAIAVCLVILLVKTVGQSTLLTVVQGEVASLKQDVGKLFERLETRALPCQAHASRLEDHGRRIGELETRVKDLERQS